MTTFVDVFGTIQYSSGATGSPVVLSDTPVSGDTIVWDSDSEVWKSGAAASKSEIYFIDSEGALPLALQGSLAYVTDTGTLTGNILASYIKTPTVWVKTNGSSPVSATVIDNTITSSTLISEIGRYIVPATGVDSEFSTHINEYVDWDGVVFTYSTPDSDDVVLINSGPNAGRIWKYAFGVWADTQTKTDYPIYNWALTSDYKVGDIVIYNNRLYQANSNIGKNINFSIGTAVNTWKQLGDGALVAEFVSGTISVTTNLALVAGSWTTYATLTIPSAGKWDVTGQIPIRYSSAVVAFRLLRNGSSIWVSDDGTNGSDSTTANAHYISTHHWNDYSFSAGDVLSYQVIERNDPAIVYGAAAKGQFNARKVSGLIPSTGQSTAYGVITSVVDNSTTTSTTPAIVPGSTFTIPSAGTWEINYSASVRSDTGAGVFTTLWNVTTNAAVAGTAATGAYSSGPALAVDTTNSSIIVETTGSTQFALYFASMSGAATARIYNGYVSGDTASSTEGSTRITYKQIGTTSTAGFTGVMSNSWNIANSYPSGTIVVRDGLLYQANAFMPAGTAFVEGTSGNTWRGLYNTTAAEYGEVNAVGQETLAQVGQAFVAGCIFNLPTPGVYEVTYDVRARINNGTAVSSFELKDSDGVVVPNSTTYPIFLLGQTFTSLDGSASRTVRITTTGSNKRYSLRVSVTAGSVVVSDVTRVSWKKISGFVGLSQSLMSGTPVAASGTAIDFTGIPSTAKRITVMFSGLSTNGTSGYIIRFRAVGGGTYLTTGYAGSCDDMASTVGPSLFTTGFQFSDTTTAAAAAVNGQIIFTKLSDTVWVGGITGGWSNTGTVTVGGGSITVGGSVDALRITTLGGVNTFDAGTVNIMYE